jgi:hypothetical protein
MKTAADVRDYLKNRRRQAQLAVKRGDTPVVADPHRATLRELEIVLNYVNRKIKRADG